MKHAQLAINSVSTVRAGLEECLDAYQAAGFKNVEFMLGHVKDYLAQDHTVADVRRLLDSRGLRCIGGFQSGVEAFSAEEQRRRNHELIVANAHLLAELGGTCLVVGTDGPGEAGADPIDGLVEAFKTLGQEIAGTRVNLCIEFNWSPVVKSLRTAAEIARRTGLDNVGVLFDPAHYHCTPTKFDQLDAANVVTIKHVHVDDMRDKPAELSNCNSDRVLPGEGCLDLKALFGRLEQHGYQGYYSIEMFNEELWALPAREAAKRMYHSLLPYCED